MGGVAGIVIGGSNCSLIQQSMLVDMAPPDATRLNGVDCQEPETLACQDSAGTGNPDVIADAITGSTCAE